MPKTDGDITKRKILQTAERLFARKGFQGTSVSEIAQEAGVNKALIYYYFQDKNDLVSSLFRNIIAELLTHSSQSLEQDSDLSQTEKTRHKVEQELRYLAGSRQIIAVMLMEALKSGNTDEFLFQCAETVIKQDVGDPSGAHGEATDAERLQFWANQFFTGFIPLISFVVLRDKWCEYFKCDPDKALDYFLEAFERSHLALQAPEPPPQSSGGEAG